MFGNSSNQFETYEVTEITWIFKVSMEFSHAVAINYRFFSLFRGRTLQERESAILDIPVNIDGRSMLKGVNLTSWRIFNQKNGSVWIA